MINYRPNKSYISKDSEKRKKQLRNLVQGRLKKGKPAKARVTSFNDPEKFGDTIRICFYFFSFLPRFSGERMFTISDLRMKNETTEGTEKGFTNDELGQEF